MHIRGAQSGDHDDLVGLIADFRVHLAGLRHQSRYPDLDAALVELQGYISGDYPIHIAEADDGTIVGYLVCRVDGDVVWAESLFVSPAWRRKGIGAKLYAEAERLAERLGAKTVYNWVHPNNAAIIGFLRKRGYTVLNLIELRRPLPGDEARQSIAVGGNTFDF